MHRFCLIGATNICVMSCVGEAGEEISAGSGAESGDGSAPAGATASSSDGGRPLGMWDEGEELLLAMQQRMLDLLSLPPVLQRDVGDDASDEEPEHIKEF